MAARKRVNYSKRGFVAALLLASLACAGPVLADTDWLYGTWWYAHADGTFLEGETIVVVAGFLSDQDIINPIAVAASAFLGSFLGDQLWFYLGRRHAAHPFVAGIIGRPIFAKAMSAIEDHPKKFILTFRFIYGIRTVSPVAVGLTEIPARDFLIVNAIAAAIWAVAFTALGYVFGQAVETALGDLAADLPRV